MRGKVLGILMALLFSGLLCCLGSSCAVEAEADAGGAGVAAGVGCDGAGVVVEVQGPSAEVDIGVGCTGCGCVDCGFTDCCGMEREVDVDYDCCCQDVGC